MSNILKSLVKNNAKLIFTFLSVGAITAIIYLIISIILLKIADLEYHLAISIAYIISVTFYFFANRKLTFKASNGNKHTQIFKFILMLALSYLITMFIITLVVKKFMLSPIMGTFIAIIATTGINFLLSRYWVFKHTNNQMCGMNS